MGESSKKSTVIDREIYEINNFKELRNANLSAFGKVWIFLKKYGVIKGEIIRFPLDGCYGRTEIKLENGKHIYVNREDHINHVKERR